jgi:hypothetical protein
VKEVSSTGRGFDPPVPFARTKKLGDAGAPSDVTEFEVILPDPFAEPLLPMEIYAPAGVDPENDPILR